MEEQSEASSLWGPRAMRLASFTLGWIVLTGGDLSSWEVGVVTIVVATALSLKLVPARPFRWRLAVLFRFVPFFISHALVGGFDVARRAFVPSMPIHPVLSVYPLRLAPQGAATIFFVNVISLLPGTLCARIEGRTLWIHVLDRRSAYRKHLEALEEVIGDLFGEALEPGPQKRGEEG